MQYFEATKNRHKTSLILNFWPQLHIYIYALTTRQSNYFVWVWFF